MQPFTLRWLIPFTLVVLLLPACSDTADDSADTTLAPVATTVETTSTTLPAGPPCFGLVQDASLPDWAGGHAFGEYHDLGGGSFVDLTSLAGCEIEGGVLKVNVEIARLSAIGAYVEDCDGFESIDIPPQELQPAADERWICYAPGEDGGMVMVQREG